MQGYVRLVPHYPTVVWFGRDVEEIARPQLDHAAIGERRRCYPRYHEPDVLDHAPLSPNAGANVLGPLPPRLVGGAADGQSSDAHDLEPAKDHLPHFVGRLEPFQDDTHIHP